MNQLDPEARKQLRETSQTLLEQLQHHPNDVMALAIAEVVAVLGPEHDPELLAHIERFRASRPEDWRVLAHERGVDRLLFHIANGWNEAQIGKPAVAVLERFATEISEARRAGIREGHIDSSFVPDALKKDKRVTVRYHASGHLAKVAIRIDDMHEATLVLDQKPGSATFTLVKERGGSGTMIRERYEDGTIHSTLNTPWHDGVDSQYEEPWTKWVMATLDEIASLTRVGGMVEQ